MRTYGRQYNADGTYTWVEVSTDANGFDDAVWLTTMAQVLQLHLGESPFFANFGIPQYRPLETVARRRVDRAATRSAATTTAR